MAIGDRRPLDPPPGMGPVRSKLPTPWVAGAIMAACVLTYAAQTSNPELTSALGLIPSRVGAQNEWYRVLTTVFAHGSPFHLLGNMSVVWTLGFLLERSFGAVRFALISLVAALGSAAFVLYLSPTDIPTIGASGMAIGYLGAVLPIATRQGRRELGIWMVQIVIISLLPFVSWQGHLGGFLLGLPCGFLLQQQGKRFAAGIPVVVFAAAVLVVLGARMRGYSP